MVAEVQSLTHLADTLRKLVGVVRGKLSQDEIDEIYAVLKDYNYPITRDELKRSLNVKETLNSLLSRTFFNREILSIANKELKDEDMPPAENLTGYDILEMADEIRRKAFCVQKCNPETCPFKGFIYRLLHTPAGVFKVRRLCTPYYKYMLRREIEELAGKKITQILEKYGNLEDLDISTLKEIREALRKTRRKEE